MQAFFTRCPELAEKETRSFEPSPSFPLPKDSYILLETFCPDARCDCRRVVFLVARGRDDRVIATLNYGWESPEFYQRWSPNDPLASESSGVFMEPSGTQSRWSPQLKTTLEWILANDADYRARVVRHYHAFKAAGDASGVGGSTGESAAAEPSKLADLAPTRGAVPASQELAEVDRGPEGVRVRLPSRFSRLAVERFFTMWGVQGRIFDGPWAADGGLPAVSAGQWLVVVPNRRNLPLAKTWRQARTRAGDSDLYLATARDVLEVAEGGVKTLLAALERVKPEELDAEGRPLPWTSPTLRPRDRQVERVDDVEISDAPFSRPRPEDPEPPEALVPTSVIVGRFEALCAELGHPPLPLSVRRGRVDRQGFVTGKLRITPEGQPTSVSIVTCPNADLAEILATLIHELAHAVTDAPGHEPGFRLMLVELAERSFGRDSLVGARERVTGSYQTVDRWVACGIRASLEGREPPTARNADDAQLAKSIRRIAKMRRLAADQVGRPEGVAATSQANDLVVAHGLERYDIAAEAVAPGQMLDRWLLLGGRSNWRYRLAATVAAWFDVFTLSLTGRMHLFGRHADLVATEYLYGVCAERIARACDEYLARWKREARRRPGATNRERVSFCDSAVQAFHTKLSAMQPTPGGSTQPDQALALAKDFARKEHDKRGLGWSHSPARSYIANAAGAAVGRSLSVVRGVDGDQGTRKLLEGGRA